MWCHIQNTAAQGLVVYDKILFKHIFSVPNSDRKLVHVHQRILTVKLHQIGPSRFFYIIPCKLLTLRMGPHFDPRGIIGTTLKEDL